VSKISLVDLAGSERAKDSGAEGKRLQVSPCVARDVLQSNVLFLHYLLLVSSGIIKYFYFTE